MVHTELRDGFSPHPTPKKPAKQREPQNKTADVQNLSHNES